MDKDLKDVLERLIERLNSAQDSVWDHPFKTSANFSQFLTPTPLPSAIFYYYPSANLANF